MDGTDIATRARTKAARESAATTARRWPTMTAEGRKRAIQSLYDGPLLGATESAFKADKGGPHAQDPAYLSGYEAGLDGLYPGDNPFCAWRQHDDFQRWLVGQHDGESDAERDPDDDDDDDEDDA